MRSVIFTIATFFIVSSINLISSYLNLTAIKPDGFWFTAALYCSIFMLMDISDCVAKHRYKR